MGFAPTSEIAGLAANERSYRVWNVTAEGEQETTYWIVSLERKSEEPVGGFLPMVVKSRAVTPDGTPVLVEGVPLTVPAESISVEAAAVALGFQAIGIQVAAATVRQLERAQGMRRALSSWAALPVAAPPQTTGPEPSAPAPEESSEGASEEPVSETGDGATATEGSEEASDSETGDEASATESSSG